MNYSNARLKAEFSDWPLGGNRRGQCVFHIEKKDKKGYRVGRTTTGKTKFDTYGGEACIVDGDDGRTYILQMTSYGDFIRVRKSDFMHQDSIFSGHPQFETLKKLIRDTNSLKLQLIAK